MDGDNGTPDDLRVSRIEIGLERYVVFSWAAPGRDALPAPDLTPAERVVRECLEAGLSDAAIAALRGTTRSTVTKQVDAVFRKLGVRSRRELIARPPGSPAQGSTQTPRSHESGAGHVSPAAQVGRAQNPVPPQT
jgi:DNA-binding CsgD family transcriptional regulator